MKSVSFEQLQEKLGGRSRSAIYVDLEKGRLPKPLKLGRRLYWKDSELDQYLIAMMDDQNA
ncbi:MAG: helix-turn-helix transcriptional regulator [Pseudomonadales bacterium]